jgi:hypothetical protein
MACWSLSLGGLWRTMNISSTTTTCRRCPVEASRVDEQDYSMENLALKRNVNKLSSTLCTRTSSEAAPLLMSLVNVRYMASHPDVASVQQQQAQWSHCSTSRLGWQW